MRVEEKWVGGEGLGGIRAEEGRGLAVKKFTSSVNAMRYNQKKG